jgi:hypothetical protein
MSSPALSQSLSVSPCLSLSSSVPDVDAEHLVDLQLFYWIVRCTRPRRGGSLLILFHALIGRVRFPADIAVLAARVRVDVLLHRLCVRACVRTCVLRA